jgi:hypothetical protein
VTLTELLDRAASELAAVERVASGASLEWRRGPLTFAAADPDQAEFRLDAAVARAATRTPDTEPSPRGPGWILFRPSALDGHAVDRAEAWFASAWRFAERP